jgi:hypothetical protein
MLLFKVEPLHRILWPSTIISCILLVLAPSPLLAQFEIADRPVQIHGFLTQGFAYSNENNYLTMSTSQGSFDFTDAGLNVSSQITDKFRVGGQAYARRIGKLGGGQVTLDWAEGEYRFHDWLGVRAGKVKTPLGLFNSTQDMEFLHTWALLPQSIYPLDLRERYLSHLGADIFGDIPAKKLGSFTYTVYAGALSNDLRGGYDYGLAGVDIYTRRFHGNARGADLRWTSPISGLLLGASYLQTPQTAEGFNEIFATPIRVDVFSDQRCVYYGQYTHGNLTLDAEYSRELQKIELLGVKGPYGPPDLRSDFDRRGWYAAASYRLSKHLELGAYHSRFFPNADRLDSAGVGPLSAPERHIFDQAVTARIDLTNFWDLKIEGHFINGFGDTSTFHGFYPQNNPDGLKPQTNLLVLRMGVNF